jgi:hypothetical protein
MIESIVYYLNLFASLCGFDGTGDYVVLGWFCVFSAFLIVSYALYFAVSRMIWPGETDPQHIKYRILNDEGQEN